MKIRLKDAKVIKMDNASNALPDTSYGKAYASPLSKAVSSTLENTARNAPQTTNLPRESV